MNYLYENSDILNRPFEAYLFDTAKDEFPVRAHFHHYAEITYMVRGSMIASLNEEEYYLQEGDMILFPGGDVHSLSAVTYDRVLFAAVKFDPARLTVNAGPTPHLTTLLRAARDQKARVFFDHTLDERYRFGERFFDCIREMKEGEIGYEVALHAGLCLLCLDIVRIWQEDGIRFHDLTDYMTNEELSIRNILEYIDAHMNEDLKVEELAKRCNMSYSHFAKRFRELYGRTCKEHLEILKIEKAEEMLHFTDLSLNDISQELGFADCSHFIRKYKQLKGVTPGSIRKAAGGA